MSIQDSVYRVTYDISGPMRWLHSIEPVATDLSPDHPIRESFRQVDVYIKFPGTPSEVDPQELWEKLEEQAQEEYRQWHSRQHPGENMVFVPKRP